MTARSDPPVNGSGPLLPLPDPPLPEAGAALVEVGGEVLVVDPCSCTAVVDVVDVVLGDVVLGGTVVLVVDVLAVVEVVDVLAVVVVVEVVVDVLAVVVVVEVVVEVVVDVVVDVVVELVEVVVVVDVVVDVVVEVVVLDVVVVVETGSPVTVTVNVPGARYVWSSVNEEPSIGTAYERLPVSAASP